VAKKKLSDSRVMVITGAGISAESGIATFRGPCGHWRNFDPARLATEAAFRRDPVLVWEWYRERRAAIRAARPNLAHVAVVQLAARAGDFLLLTQNVDDLHDRAEFAGRRLSPEQRVQIHGDIFTTRCNGCHYSRREPDADFDPAPVPLCPVCEAALRPGVVWFGEELPWQEVARVEGFLAAASCELTLVVGTTALFPYIVDWAVTATGATGALVEVNPEGTPLTPYATETLRQPAAVALPPWVAAWE
jgi:NAD-dependent deacetylase